MTKYLVLYRSNVTAMEQMASATPEQQQAGMQAWMDWAQRAGDTIVELGSPLAPAAGDAAATLGGFSIMQADSIEALNSQLADHPHRHMGGEIEVHQFLQMPGM